MTDKIKRKNRRVELDQPINIVDIINGGEIGELVNVSIGGIMIMSDREIPTHSIFQLSLQLPAEIQGSKTIEVGTDSLWCREIENFHRYWVGFHIIDASDAALAQLVELIKHHGK